MNIPNENINLFYRTNPVPQHQGAQQAQAQRIPGNQPGREPENTEVQAERNGNVRREQFNPATTEERAADREQAAAEQPEQVPAGHPERRTTEPAAGTAGRNQPEQTAPPERPVENTPANAVQAYQATGKIRGRLVNLFG